MTLSRLLSLTLAASVALGCGGDPGAPPRDPPDDPEDPPPPPPPPPFDPVVDLRADVDRDGLAELDDAGEDEGEDTWTDARGAIVLANLDDDLELCTKDLSEAQTDASLAGCHDASDEVVNGPDDALDLAPLAVRAWPEAPDDAVATVRVEPVDQGRLFRRDGEGWTPLQGPLPVEALRAGVALGLEARDVVRDLEVWDGTLRVTLRIQRAGQAVTAKEDAVALRVAPVVLSSHLDPLELLFVGDVLMVPSGERDPASIAFRAALGERLAAAGLPPAVEFTSRDRWLQDLFETGWASMPGPGGTEHRMRVLLRAASQDLEGAVSPLRRGSRVVFLHRGHDVAVVQQYDPAGRPPAMVTLDAMGNTEVLPPHAGYPLGGILRGSTPEFFPDPTFARMLDAQGVQPVLHLDTSWLSVGHVDELVSVVPSAAAPRGFALVVADPALARQMLVDLEASGHGDTLLFEGLADRYGNPAERTVSAVLADEGLMAANAEAAAHVEAQLAVLRAALDLADAELVRAPFLHQRLNGKLVAYQPGTANLVVLSPSRVLVADPHGPRVNGVDPFRAQFEAALAPHGIAPVFIDDWRLYHVVRGEVHCATNAWRTPPASPWWEALDQLP